MNSQKETYRRGRRIWIVWIVCLGTVALLVLFLADGQQQPKYKGRTVTQWVETPLGSDLPVDVINAFGADAVPHLASALTRKPSLLNKAGWGVWRKLPSEVRRRWAKFAPVDVPGSSHRAANWLKVLGPDAQAALPLVIEIALRGKDRYARDGAIHTLGLIGAGRPEAIHALVTLLDDSDNIIRNAAAVSLAPSGTNAAPAVPQLLQIINSQEEPYNALLVLASIGPPAREAIPVILEKFKQAPLQGNALTALAGIGAGDEQTVSMLVNSVASLNSNQRALVVETLLKIGPPAKAALPMLLSMRRNETNILRLLAAIAIARIKQRPAEAVEALREGLEKRLAHDPPLTIRIPSDRVTLPESFGLSPVQAAAWYLADFGPEGAALLPELETAMSGGKMWTSVLAARAVWRITTNTTETALVLASQLQQNDGLSRYLGLETLGEMGLEAASVAPTLVDFINSKTNSWRYRRQALHALQKIDPNAASRLKLH